MRPMRSISVLLLATLSLMAACQSNRPTATNPSVTLVPTVAATSGPTSAPSSTASAGSTATPQADAATADTPATATISSTAQPAQPITATQASGTAANGAVMQIPSLKLAKVVDGLTRPVYLTHAGDGSGTLYVVEQPGRIRLLRESALVETPFLDITDRVGSNGNEQGLLSVAFPQDYKSSGVFFVDYTDKNGDTHIARFNVNQDRATANPDSELMLLKIDQPYSNHNGGQLQFGPDGMLYIGMGDGGSQGDPQNRAQNPEELLGKLLRIDVSKSSAEQPYAIPPDNPQLAKPEVWALGLRNPWRFSFDRATNDLYIGDVGQNRIEEVNFVAAGSKGGENFGWNAREGLEDYNGGEKQAGFIDPVTQYEHSDGCSVTGGYVYRGQAIAGLQGVYLYGDYCNGNMWTLHRDTSGAWVNQPLPNAGFQMSSFGEDEAGELYVLDLDGGVYRVMAG